jgi:hypothetical protein
VQVDFLGTTQRLSTKYTLGEFLSLIFAISSLMYLKRSTEEVSVRTARSLDGVTGIIVAEDDEEARAAGSGLPFKLAHC